MAQRCGHVGDAVGVAQGGATVQRYRAENAAHASPP
jgi:hypothetical protein